MFRLWSEFTGRLDLQDPESDRSPLRCQPPPLAGPASVLVGSPIRQRKPEQGPTGEMFPSDSQGPDRCREQRVLRGRGGARRGKQGRGHPPSGLGFKGHPRQHSNQPMVLTSLWTWWLLLWAQTVLQALHWLGVWLCGREFVLGVLRVHVLLLLRRVTGRKLLASSKHALFTRASQHLAQEPGTHCTRAGPAKRPAKLRLRTTHRWGAWQQPDLTARARAPAPTPPPPPENRLGNRQALRAAGNPSPSLLPRLLSGLNLLGANAEQLPQVAV